MSTKMWQEGENPLRNTLAASPAGVCSRRIRMPTSPSTPSPFTVSAMIDWNTGAEHLVWLDGEGEGQAAPPSPHSAFVEAHRDSSLLHLTLDAASYNSRLSQDTVGLM